ncbi:hypothetical protein TDB9533_03979 [Thalassocella blandensis]|nr:hypothetical protein TDB9533_03979 [Thalassocella blandensis]
MSLADRQAPTQPRRDKPKTPPPKSALWLAIRFTHFSLESLDVAFDSDLPIMVAHKNIVCGATRAILQYGVTVGMPVATAHCLNGAESDADNASEENPPWRTYPREHNSEQKKLKQLCDALYNITPHIQPYQVTNHLDIDEFGILLEVSRCLRLFKGFTAIVSQVEQCLQQANVHFQLAQAHTAEAAWLLSFSPQTLSEHYRQNDYLQQIKALPLDLLYAHKHTVTKLKKSGFFNFSDLIKQIEQTPLHTLTQRFGEEFSEYLLDTLALSPGISQSKTVSEPGISHSAPQLQSSLFRKPVAMYQPDISFCDHIQFDYPIENCEQLQTPMQHLLQKLSEFLVKHQQQTQKISWNMYDIYQNKDSLPVYLERLHRDFQLALELSMIQLEGKTLPFAVDTLELFCEHSLPVNYQQHAFSSQQNFFKREQDFQHDSTTLQAHKNALAITAAKLTARLGDNALFTLSPKDSHIPELSFGTASLQEKSTPIKPQTKLNTDRPSWIFNTPYSIGTRQNALFWKGKLELLQGPERIEGLWWKKPTARDYFVAQRDDDVRLWVFFDCHKDEWFVHGVFA